MQTQTKADPRRSVENTPYSLTPRSEEMSDPSWDYRPQMYAILYRMQLAEEQRQRELEMIDSTEHR